MSTILHFKIEIYTTKDKSFDINKKKQILNLYEGYYKLTLNKFGYEKYEQEIVVKEDGIYFHGYRNENLYININSDRKLNKYLLSTIEVVSEYGFSGITNIGINFNIAKEYRRNRFEVSLLLAGISGDFFNKSLTLKYSIANTKWYLFSPIYIQLGTFGFGDELEFIFKDNKIDLRGVLSFKVGINIELFYPKVNMKLFLKVASENNIKDSSITGVFYGAGVSFEYLNLK